MAELLILRFVHVVGGIFWAGSVFFFSLFLVPTLTQMGPDGGKTMQRIAASKYPQRVAIVAILTILAGLRLYMIQMRNTPGWAGGRMGMTFGIGGLAAIIAWVIGVSVNRPSAAKLATLGAAVQASGGPPTPEQQAEMARLRARLGSAGKAVASLLAITVVTMALARYLV